MKYDKKSELDVDFIGGLGPLTPEEKKAVNDYFASKKSQPAKTRVIRETKTVKREKFIA